MNYKDLKKQKTCYCLFLSRPRFFPSVQIQEYLYSFQTMCYKYEYWSFFKIMMLLFNAKRGGIVNCPSVYQSVQIYMLHSIVHQPNVTPLIIKIFCEKGCYCLRIRGTTLSIRLSVCLFGVICYTLKCEIFISIVR